MEPWAYLSLLGAGVIWHGIHFYKKAVLDPLSDRMKVWAHERIVPKGTIAPKGIHACVDLKFELFLSSKASRTDCILPTAWSRRPPDHELPGGMKTYGHEAAVLESLLHFIEQGDVDLEVKEDSWLANTGSSRVMLASGSSNLASQEVIGTPMNPTLRAKLGNSEVSLTYTIGLGDGHVTRKQYGEMIDRTAHCLHGTATGKKLQAEMDSGRQVADYLLVTRIPGPTDGSVYTVLAGLHGPGTRSAELLFNSVSGSDLEELASKIHHKSGQVTFFQAIFRASKFREVDGSDVPTRLELVTEQFPPVRIP